MHELSIATSILESVQAESARRPGSRFTRVGLRVGEWAALDPEALRFCWGVLVEGTALTGLELEIETQPRRQRCMRCQNIFVVHEYEWACPACASSETVPVGGHELEVAYLEMEEP